MWQMVKITRELEREAGSGVKELEKNEKKCYNSEASFQ
jgi:hypothetical protein